MYTKKLLRGAGGVFRFEVHLSDELAVRRGLVFGSLYSGTVVSTVSHVHGGDRRATIFKPKLSCASQLSFRGHSAATHDQSADRNHAQDDEGSWVRGWR